MGEVSLGIAVVLAAFQDGPRVPSRLVDTPCSNPNTGNMMGFISTITLFYGTGEIKKGRFSEQA